MKVDVADERGPAGQLEPIAVSRARDAVTEQIGSLILCGTYQCGDRLPSEQELARTLQVGRRAVREALQALQTRGLVEVRMGSGTFVVRNDLDSFLNSLTTNVRAYLATKRAELAHCSQFRELIEGAAIEELTSRSPEALARLEEALAKQELAAYQHCSEAYARSHFEFHKAIVDGLENPIISMLFEQVLSLVQDAMEVSGSDPSIQQEAIAEHRAILEAVRDGDAETASNVLSLHLKHFRRNLDDLYMSQTAREEQTDD